MKPANPDNKDGIRDAALKYDKSGRKGDAPGCFERFACCFRPMGMRKRPVSGLRSCAKRMGCYALLRCEFATALRTSAAGGRQRDLTCYCAEYLQYIEVFYNRQRIHQTLGYCSPLAVEALADVA